MFSVADLGCVGFDGRINVNYIAAEGPFAINAVNDASTQERLFNPSKTTGAIILHGSPLSDSILVDSGWSSELENQRGDILVSWASYPLCAGRS